MEYLYIFLFAFLIMLTSVSGIFFLQKNAKDFFEKNLDYLISFSAGVFLIISGHLIFKSFELFNSYIYTSFFVSLGFFFSWLVVRILPETHHHHDKCCIGHKDVGRKVILGDGIHNIADGIVLATAFISSPMIGFSLFISIFIHEFLQEISEFFVLKQAGYSTKKAIIINFIVSSTILIGVLIGMFISNYYFIQAFVLALSSGFFLNIVFADLLPHKHKVDSNKDFIKHLFMVICGLILMFSVLSFFGHEHVSIINN